MAVSASILVNTVDYVLSEQAKGDLFFNFYLETQLQIIFYSLPNLPLFGCEKKKHNFCASL